VSLRGTPVKRMSLLQDVELAFVTGKGGVGKTTVALATALASARDGRRVVLCEVAGQARAARLYGADAPRPGREIELEDGLWATTIDPVVALEEWAGRQIGSRRLVGLLTHSNAFAAFVNAAPGARELVAITKAWELGRRQRWVKGSAGYDLVVVDGPASGHGVGMLRTPRTFAEIARVGPIASQARKVVTLLEDPARSAVVAVALPAELPVSETLDLEARVEGAVGRPLDAVVVNGVLPRRFSAAEVDRVLRRDGAVPHPVAAAARRQHGHASSQQGQLRRLRRHSAAHVTTLPYVAGPHLGIAEVRVLAEALAQRL
jgi:anion-transporting  ArsA/GET3 family ATPase